MRQQAYLSAVVMGLLRLLGRHRLEAQADLLPLLLRGVTNRLDSPLPAIRWGPASPLFRAMACCLSLNARSRVGLVQYNMFLSQKFDVYNQITQGFRCNTSLEFPRFLLLWGLGCIAGPAASRNRRLGCHHQGYHRAMETSLKKKNTTQRGVIVALRDGSFHWEREVW